MKRFLAAFAVIAGMAAVLQTISSPLVGAAPTDVTVTAGVNQTAPGMPGGPDTVLVTVHNNYPETVECTVELWPDPQQPPAGSIEGPLAPWIVVGWEVHAGKSYSSQFTGIPNGAYHVNWSCLVYEPETRWGTSPRLFAAEATASPIPVVIGTCFGSVCLPFPVGTTRQIG